MRRRRSPEIIAGRVNADGSIAWASGEFSVSKGATGFYVLSFPASFRLGAITLSPATHNNVTFQFNFTNNNVLGSISNTCAAGDFAFSFTAAGVQQ